MSAVATIQPTRVVRRATREDMPALAGVMARSYEDCPAWAWYLPPGSRHRLERMERFFRSFLEGFYAEGERECLTTDDRAGAALWDPPAGWELGAAGNARLLAAMVPVFRRHVTRPLRAFSVMEGEHPERPHCFLSALAVDPDAGGKGVAAALVEPVLERCDESCTPAYLETGRPRSRDFFAGWGFEVTAEMTLPGEGPPVWGMWREPL